MNRNLSPRSSISLFRSLPILSVLGFAIPIAASLASFGQSPQLQTTTDTLRQIVEKQADAWNRGDIAEFMAPYWNDDRLTFCSGGKTQRGWRATFENYKKNYPDSKTMGKLTFSDLETTDLGPDAILMIGKWNLERAEPVGGNFSLVWKRIDGVWVIVHDHSSALKP